MPMSIPALAQSEYMLYGGATYNAAAPSYYNGYMANSGSIYNSYMNTPYYNPNSIYSSQGDSFTPSESKPDAEKAATENKAWDVLADHYLEGMHPSESLLGAAGGGAAFALLTNQRLLAHPINSFSTIGKVEKMFADVKTKGSVLNRLWSNPETHKLMTDAYARMHKLEGGAKSRLGMFKARIDETTYNALKGEMEAALRSGDKKKIALATEKIRVATNAKTGWVPRGWAKVKGIFGGESTVKPVSERIVEGTVAEAAEKNLVEKGAKSLGAQLKHGFKGAGGLGGLLMMGIEFVMSWDNIKAAFSKDKDTGWKQVGQTTVKGLGSLVGWTAGEAVGAWAGAKLGAMAGTAIAPGVGTVIGAVAGLVGGSIGCWAMGKLTKKLVGEDVGAKAKVEEMKKSDDGKQALLQYTIDKYNHDKKLPPDVYSAVQALRA